MFAQSDNVFVLSSAGCTLTFVRDARSVVTHMFLTIVEGDFKAERKQPN